MKVGREGGVLQEVMEKMFRHRYTRFTDTRGLRQLYTRFAAQIHEV